ncbi:hypothetical protein ACVIHA_000040 [Bradyrhizobium liaoningense]
MPPWKRWYKTARWQALRIEIFVRDLFTCQCGCGVIEGGLSPSLHPAMERVPVEYEPKGLGEATGRGAEPSA